MSGLNEFDEFEGLISILRKYDYNAAAEPWRHLRSRGISILQKYDYKLARVLFGLQIFTFQFYESTIIIYLNPKGASVIVFSILHKYD